MEKIGAFLGLNQYKTLKLVNETDDTIIIRKGPESNSLRVCEISAKSEKVVRSPNSTDTVQTFRLFLKNEPNESRATMESKDFRGCTEIKIKKLSSGIYEFELLGTQVR